MKLTKYVLFVSTMAAILYVIEAVRWHKEPLALNGLAMEPVIHLMNSNAYYDENEQELAMHELEKAIRKTLILKDEVTHKRAVELIDQELPQLIHLINADQIPAQQLHYTYSSMLVALSYLQVYSAKVFLMEDRPADMKECLSKAIYILDKASVLSGPLRHEQQQLVYTALENMYEQPLVHKDYLNQLDRVLVNMANITRSKKNSEQQVARRF